MSTFIHDHKDRFGVAPICRVLTEHGCKIAPETYYAHMRRARSARAVRDERVLVEIRRIHTSVRGAYTGRGRSTTSCVGRAALTVSRWPAARWSG